MPAIASHPMQLVLILAVVLLFFGAARLPALAKSLGQSARVLRTEMREPDADAPTPATSTAPDPASPSASPQRDSGS
ncbi:MAG: twin-arginine translocase TatA/TatE family subunit [Microbacterium sp.]